MKPHKLLGMGLAAALFGAAGMGAASAQDQQFIRSNGRHRRLLSGGRATPSGEPEPPRTRHPLLGQSTGGSVFSVNAIKGGDLNLVSCGQTFSTTLMAGNFADTDSTGTPAPCSRFTRAAHRCGPQGCQRALDDLKGKRVSISNPAPASGL